MDNGDAPGNTGDTTTQLHERAAGQIVDSTITRYMELCDVPAVLYSRSELLGLFAEDAVWEGIGSSNQAEFGRRVGPEAIVEMLENYLPPKRHFVSNTHLLTQRHVTINDTAAEGRWVMQRFSKYENGRSDLTVTRLRVGFEIRETGGLITSYQPEKLFSLSLDAEAFTVSAAAR